MQSRGEQTNARRGGRRVRVLGTPRQSFTALAAFAVLAPAAACSGGEAAPASTSTPTSLVATPHPSTTELGTTSTGPQAATSVAATEPTTPAAPAPSSTVPVVTSAPTSAPRPTTVPSSTLALSELESAVAADYTAAYESWTNCLAALPDCDLEGLAANRTGDYLLMSQTQIGRYIDAGHTTSDLDRRQLTIESVTVEASGVQASVISCEVDGSVRYDAAGAIVNDEFSSIRRASILLFEGDAWKVAGIENLEVGSGEEANLCVAS